MNVVDSSCWLEVFEDTPIANIIVPIIADEESLIVPTVVLYEVFKKLSATKGIVYAERFAQRMLDSIVVTLDPELSISAANISRKYKLPMADSIIYATVMQYDAVLWTTDQHFEGLPNVRYFDKTLH